MQPEVSKRTNWICCVIMAVLAVFLMAEAYFGPVSYGEIDSNALPVISLQYRGSILMQQSDIRQAKKDFPELYEDVESYEDFRSAKLLKVTEDKWMSFYFPIYPLFCIPVKLILALVGANQERCFEVTNALLVIAAFYFVLRKLKAGSRQRFLAAAMLVLSPAIFHYVNYICYEAFIFSMLTISLVQYSSGKYKSSAFALALGGMSNSAVMAVGIVMVCEYLGRILYRNRGTKLVALIRDNFKETFLYGLCYVPCLIPFAVQRYYLSQSLYVVTSDGTQGLTGRVLAYLFDPNLGFCSFAPLAAAVFLILILVSVLRRRYHALVWLLFLLGSVTAVSFMPHINCGMEFCARYVVWIYPVIPIFLATEGYELFQKVRGRAVCYCAVILSTAFFLYWNNGVLLYHFNNCSEWLLNYAPALYDPLSSTFYCRTLHVDGGYSYTQPAYHKNKKTDEITKLIYKADAGAAELVLNDVTGTEDSLRYLEQEIEKRGEDGKFHYIDLPVWGKYEIYEKDLAIKESLTEGGTLLDESDFTLKPTGKKQKKRFPIKIKKDCYYKIELRLAEDFDFSAAKDLIVDFRIDDRVNPQMRANAFLAKGRYDYRFYFNTEALEQETEEVNARVVLRVKSGRAKQGRIESFRVVEMQKN